MWRAPSHIVALGVLASSALCGIRSEAGPLPHRWVYIATNLLVQEKVNNAMAIVERAANAGYNGVVLSDSKFCRWDDLPEQYLRNVRRVRQACRDHKLACIACVCPIGYANDLLSRDPNLAEGLPVVERVSWRRAVNCCPPTIPPTCSTAASSSRAATCQVAGASSISRAQSRSLTPP